ALLSNPSRSMGSEPRRARTSAPSPDSTVPARWTSAKRDAASAKYTADPPRWSRWRPAGAVTSSRVTVPATASCQATLRVAARLCQRRGARFQPVAEERDDRGQGTATLVGQATDQLFLRVEDRLGEMGGVAVDADLIDQRAVDAAEKLDRPGPQRGGYETVAAEPALLDQVATQVGIALQPAGAQ